MWMAAIAEALPMAVGVALSPLPIAAVLVMMMTPRARTNAPAFLVGWIGGVMSVVLIVALVPGMETSQGAPTQLSGLLKTASGVFLLGLAIKQWRGRPTPEDEAEMPRTLAHLDSFGPRRSAGFGFLLSAVNPKNLLLNAAGAATIDASMLAPAPQTIALVAFVILASASVATPVLGFLLFRERMEPVLERWKDWLVRNDAAVRSVTFVLIGVMLIGNGARILAS